jgi:hypothetical protein
VPPRFQNIIFNGDNRLSAPPDKDIPAQSVFIDGIGNVEFVADETYVTYPSTIPVSQPGGNNPKEFAYAQQSAQMASKSITENYPKEQSDEILQNLGPSLNPKPGPFANVTIPFLIIRSFDFFKQKFTVIPKLSPFATGAFDNKTKALAFISQNVLSPQVSKPSPINTNTPLSVEDIRTKLKEMNVTDEELLGIGDKVRLVEKIKEKGIAIFDEEDPLKETVDLVKQENDTIEELATAYTSPGNFRPDGVILPTKFQSKEVEEVAEQCCEPSEDAKEELDVPELEEPEILTEEEVLEFVDGIDKMAEILDSCSAKKAEAVAGVQKVQKIREDLYPIKFFMEKRQSFLEDFKSGKLANFSVFSAEQILAISKTLNFSVASFLSSSILSPDNTSSYTNQSGVLSKPLEKYFLIISDNPEIVKEMKTLFEMYSPGGSLSDFVQSSDNLPKTLKGTQPPKGILYKEFYDKFNSGDRVDFLFTAQEQGYLTEKPSSSELLSPEGEEKIKALKIDEEKSAQFLRTYHKEEKARVEVRLKKLKDASYFTSLENHAKEQAATVFGLSKVLAPLGKVLIKKMEDECDAIVSFSKELDNKIAKLEYQSDRADLCIETQVQSIESSIPPPPVENVPPSGSDPFGSTPPNPFMPGPTKNKYWKEYTKALQTVSFMPIPDVKYLTKRLFRYYPVGLQIDVPVPPKVLPTLASGIPDMKISIPFPILWKHLTSLSTPMGQFVLWLAYCAPYTVSLYMMYIDENLNVVFLSTAKGKVEVPAKSLKWDDDSLLAKSVIERIPALKIPLKDLPAVDNLTDNKNADDKKGAIQELQNRIKAKIDNLDSTSRTLNQKRIEDRTTLRKYREKISKTLDIKTGNIDIAAVQGLLGEVKEMVKRKSIEMLEFEPFSVPKTQKKATGSPTVTEFKNLISKAKSLKNGGAMVETKTINIEKIFSQKSLAVLDTPFGKKIAKELDEEMLALNVKMNEAGVVDKVKIAEERCKLTAKKVVSILSKGASKITNKALGYVEVPINLVPSFLPEPARSAIAIEPMPTWMPLVTAATKAAANTLVTSTVEKNFITEMTSKINLGERLPDPRDLLSLGIISAVKVVLSAADIKKLVPIGGWPTEISYPSVNMMKQALKDAKNAIWKIKIRPPGGGIPPVTISPAMVKKVVSPIMDASIDLIFASILQRFLQAEQNVDASISLQQTLRFTNVIFGNDIWDLNEDDVKQVAVGFVRDALLQAESGINSILTPIDNAKKTFDSILKKLAPFSKQKTEKKEEPSLDLGGAVASSLFKSYIAKYVSGDLPSPPFPVVLLGCATGVPGWTIFTKMNPFAAIEKLPGYERLSLKNVPFVIFLDMIAATAQRYGGAGSNYVTPYFVPDS